MSTETIRLLCELSDLHGCPSGEHAVRAYMKQRLEPVSDEIVYDNLGGIFAVKHSERTDAPRLMMAGHMDEVGFMVISVTANGMLRVRNLGGIWGNALLQQRVVIPVQGTLIPGLIVPWTSRPDSTAPVTIDDVVIDIGAASDQEVAEWGIYPGQLVSFDTKAVFMNNQKYIMGKAWDDRVGCAMAIQVMEGLKDESLGCELIAGGTVQEEAGRRGAAAAAGLIKPDLFFALEGPPAADISGDPKAFGRLGEGVQFRVIDRELLLSPELRDLFLDIAHTHHIPYQFFISPGGTDAGIIQTTGRGVLSSVIGIPVRTPHTPQSIIHIDDYEAAVEFVLQFTRAFDRSVFESLLPR